MTSFLAHVTSGALAQSPDLYSPLDGLGWEVLAEAQPTLELYHRLVDADVTVRHVVFLEHVVQVCRHRTELGQLVRIIPLGSVVGQVEVLPVPDDQKPITRHDFSKLRQEEARGGPPIIRVDIVF